MKIRTMTLAIYFTLAVLVTAESAVAQQQSPATGTSSTRAESWPETSPNAPAQPGVTGGVAQKIDIRNLKPSITFVNDSNVRAEVFYHSHGIAERLGLTIMAPHETKRIEVQGQLRFAGAAPADGSWGTAIVYSNKRTLGVRFDGKRLTEVQPKAMPQPRNAPIENDYLKVSFSNQSSVPLNIKFEKAPSSKEVFPSGAQSVVQQVGANSTIMYYFKPFDTYVFRTGQKTYKLPVTKNSSVVISAQGVTVNGHRVTPSKGGLIKNPLPSTPLGSFSYNFKSGDRLYLESTVGRVGLGAKKGALTDIVEVTQSGAQHALKHQNHGLKEINYNKPLVIWSTGTNNRTQAITDGAYWNTYLQPLNYKSEQLWIIERHSGQGNIVRKGDRVYIRRADKADVYLYAKPDGVLGVTNRHNERTLFTLTAAGRGR